jgi:hypothetical protein
VSSEYLLAVGTEGAARLSIVQELYGEESKLILKKAGLRKNMKNRFLILLIKIFNCFIMG